LKLLAIDTATEACSAALYIDGEVLEKYEVAPRRHAELILPMVDSLLAEAELKLTSLGALAFGRGPGAFTGVRIATGVIQGLAFASDLPVIPISTLAAMAQGASTEADTILSTIDARMSEIYWGLFSVGNDGIVRAISEELVSKPETLNVEVNSTCFGVGTGWSTYKDFLLSAVGSQLKGFDADYFPRASDILTLAAKEFSETKMIAATDTVPVYLRNKVTA
jgi:tRNA threonylcarbamoyladenosine biosynthesis protein TsaB